MTVTLKDFKDLEKKFLKERDGLKKQLCKEIKERLSPYFKIEESDYYNEIDEFYFVFELYTKNWVKFDFSVEDSNHYTETDWSYRVHIYELPNDEFAKKHKPIDDCCIWKSKNFEKTIEFLIGLSKEI